MRNRFLILIMSLIFLAACEPYSPAPGSSSYELMQRSQATAAAAESNARFYGQQLTATAEAPAVRLTETAGAWLVQNQADQATQAAQATNVSGGFTAQALQVAIISTATAAQNQADLALAQKRAQETAIANDIERNNLELERQRLINKTEALRPYLMLAFAGILVVVVTMLIIRDKRFRPMPRDERGDAIPILDTIDGTVTNIDRNSNYLSTTKRADLPLLPAVTAARQDLATMRDQLIALATHGLPDSQKDQARRQLASQEMSRQMQLGSGRHEIVIVPAAQALPVIKDVIPQIMQDAVDAEILEDKHE